MINQLQKDIFWSFAHAGNSETSIQTSLVWRERAAIHVAGLTHDAAQQWEEKRSLTVCLWAKSTNR
jgi:HD superfamily phosphohydrolase YqeK